MLTPEQIRSREFLVSVRGYDRDEVHAFLAEVADAIGTLRERLDQAAAEVRAAQDAAAKAGAEAKRHKVEGEAAGPAAASGAQGPGMFAEIGQQTQRILEAAAEAAEGIKQQAKREMEQEIRKARRQADKLVAEGERRREELDRGTAELVRKREEVTASLRAVARGLEQSLRELTLTDPPAATMREALRGDARGSAQSAASGEPDVTPRTDTEAGVQPSQDRAPEATVVDESAPAGGTTDDIEPPPGEPEPADAASDARADVRADRGDAPAAGSPATPGDLRAQALEMLHPKVVRKIKRGLQDLQNVALERLRSSAPDTDPSDLLPAEQEFAVLGEGVAEFLEQAYLAGVTAGSNLAPGGAHAGQAPADLASRFAADVVHQVNAPLAATLRMGVAAREPATGLSDRVGAVFAELKHAVAEELAATHLVHAFESGMQAAWSAAGVPARRWVLGREPRCPEGRCRTNDQSGALVLGEAFPSGHDHPPVHVGCTCTTAPVLEATS